MIKAIIFDWGGVLIKNPSHGLMNYFSSVLGCDAKVLSDAYAQYESGFQKGEITERSIWQMVCHDLGVSEPRVPSLWKEGVSHVFSDQPEVFRLLDRLRMKGHLLGFISNTEVPAMEFFLERGYGRLFDATIFSCAVGMAKPEEGIYRRAIEELKVRAEETIFIDDKPLFVKGARKAGMNGIVFTGVDQLVCELSNYSAL